MAFILIVDDDRELCELLRNYLGRLGHCVSVAHGGQEALACLERCTPDLVVTDLMMPGMSGLELLRRLKADGRLSAPVLVYTGCQEYLEEARRLGADACLAKGDSLRTFRDAVTGLLESKEARGQRCMGAEGQGGLPPVMGGLPPNPPCGGRVGGLHLSTHAPWHPRSGKLR